ncbi:pentatricopeptide repeat-containing protein At3g02650, mitochondrial [Actinidia eriantha]|uniref:pentatricopeptide repeat-containing protein At3g02650, mitochondrial n=1 Tax=Actinidia eriantha TaxID=165200 RepID=UPI00258652EA|nr:pentatricopeptide repeat-containing protein At3g02650, mitochondrial [Actinidia eriantha]XP_057470971.1 pentatricopeptide repeat-containing protein At3g02650, mitochondrial [Actinidia eriantha]
MWRSMAARRACLSIRSRGLKLFEVTHYQTRTTVQSSFPSHLISPNKIPFFPNPRFLSHDSSNPDAIDVSGSQVESSIPESNEESYSVFEENPVSVTSESDSELSSSLAFEEIETGSDNVVMGGFASGDDKSIEEDEVPEVDFEKLECVLSLLQSSSSGSGDGSFELSFDEMDLTIHEEFVIRVLETPLVPGGNLISFFKWASKKPKFSVTTWSVEVIVRAISTSLKKKEAYALWDLIKEIGEKENGVLTTGILNELISLFSKLGKAKAGFEVFNMFGDCGCIADAETYYFTIEALCRRSFFDWACSICENMLSAGELPESEKVGKVISYLCKGSKAKEAHVIYLFAKEKGRYPPRSSVNFLISSLCQGDETVRLALEMLDDFSGEERKYAIKPFSSVIRGLCRIKDVEGAKELLFKMIDAGPTPGNAIFNFVINGLSKAGDMEEARKMMKLMKIRGLKPDVYTYSVIMSGYAKGGEMEAACKLLAEAKRKHPKLSPVTYHTLIRGYCKLEEFDKALKTLGEMKEYRVQPNADEYNKLVQSLCLKALDWGTAEKLGEEMKENGLHLNGITKGLIRAVKEMEEEEVGSGEVTEGV